MKFITPTIVTLFDKPIKIDDDIYSPCNAANEFAFLDLASISANFAFASASAIMAAAEYEFISAADVVLIRVSLSIHTWSYSLMTVLSVWSVTDRPWNPN